jgi:hypothetical protein
MKRLFLTSMIAVLLLSASVMTASAHSVTIQPPGQDEPAFSDVISTSWARAHCNAAAPGTATANSDGVVVFSPNQALPCDGDPGDGAPGKQ